MVDGNLAALRKHQEIEAANDAKIEAWFEEHGPEIDMLLKRIKDLSELGSKISAWKLEAATLEGIPHDQVNDSGMMKGKTKGGLRRSDSITWALWVAETDGIDAAVQQLGERLAYLEEGE